MKRLPILLKYAVFAAIATGINIAVQRGVAFFVEGSFSLYSSLFFGTIAGLVVKYLLDKRWIFFDRTSSLRGHSVKFTLYSAMGVVTTIIFWGTEVMFEALSDDRHMRYVGAVVGLSIGYVTKYYLDRRFVFQAQPS